MPSQIPVRRRHFRSVFSLVGALSLSATLIVSQYLWFQRSDVFADAVRIINRSSVLKERIGAPITAGWPRVALTIRRGPGDVRARVPIRGARGTATVSLRAVNGNGGWQLEQLDAVIDASGASVTLLPYAPLRTPNRAVIHGSGHLYFVALGQTAGVDVNDLARRYQQRYGLSIDVLPQLPLHYEGRQQATLIMRVLKDGLSELVADPRSVIIAVTDVDMDNYSWRDDERFAVVSTAGLSKEQFEKEVSRSLGLLWFELPMSTDRRTVLYDSVRGRGDIDRMSGDF